MMGDLKLQLRLCAIELVGWIEVEEVPQSVALEMLDRLLAIRAALADDTGRDR